ncbi:Brp/Blh family beta-carotene 15,15'-dioxygenase [Winogradskyella sp.]|uniref:Brp/Blh family beta-carotene 15,15'-dioxygenase n=1 Tax=Winogradskyella sp. TaxID=1883156 RepID=UPI0025DA1FE2|nr:Brp/Blh family beta-carotene 15,15'-dioxygenase [Winogradskyella sp.]
MTSNIEEYVACFFILSIGLIHGANDIKIINTVYKNQSLNLNKTLFLYVLIILIGTLMFYFMPQITLLLFIIVSGYHFGEQHFHDIKTDYRPLKYLLYLSYGYTILSLLFYTNWEESAVVINQIARITINESFFFYNLIGSLGLFVISFSLLIKAIPSPLRELFYLIVFFIVFKTASLIWAFAIYFVLWHSLPSLVDQISFLSNEVNKKTILNYIKSSLVYWLISIVGLFVFFSFLIRQSDMFYAVFFSFLAAITFPHVLVMSKIFKH